MADTADAEIKPERTRRKRERATRASLKTRAVTPVSKSVKPPVEKPAPAARKAPTPLSSDKQAKRIRRNRMFIMLAIVIVGIGSSAMVGSADKGLIDVNAAITTRNEKIKESGSNEIIVPVQNTNPKPDGGLTGLGIGTPKATESGSDEVTSAATSTEDTATSTTESAESDEAETTEPSTDS